MINSGDSGLVFYFPWEQKGSEEISEAPEVLCHDKSKRCLSPQGHAKEVHLG